MWLNQGNPGHIAILLVAILMVDLVVLFLIRFFPDFWGKSINDWYNQFGLNAVISDVLIIFLGFLIAFFAYGALVEPTYGWNLWLFIGVLVLVQLLHDLFFYFCVILPIPSGHNGMIDVFKSYADAGQSKILLADGAMMVGSALIANGLLSAPAPVSVFLGGLTVYAIPYILSTRNKYSI